MSRDESSSSLERELLISHEGSIRIEEVDGKPVARFIVPPGMQGHTFAVDLSDTSSHEVPAGPFRLEYALGSEFAIYENKLTINGFEAGYSHVVLAPKLEGGSHISQIQRHENAQHRARCQDDVQSFRMSPPTPRCGN